MHTATIAVLVVVIYGIVFTTQMLEHIAGRVDIVQKILPEQAPIVHDTEIAVSNSPQNDARAHIDAHGTEVAVSLSAQNKKRRPIAHGTAFSKSISSQNDGYKFEIEPMWSCSDTDRKKKLVFLPLFRTAGSSLRQLLRRYAETCNAGYVTVINCGTVTLESIKNDNWMKEHKHHTLKHGSACKLKRTIHRNNTVVDHSGHEGSINYTFLEEAKIDILSGHLPLGIDENWTDENGQQVYVQYLTFFRESKRKAVSAILYTRPKLSFDEAVKHIKESVKSRVANSEYLTDTNSIMTPVQRDDYRKRNVMLTLEESVNLMIQNFKEKNVLVGIVERMSQSLEMLQHVVDKDGELDALFESFGKRPPGTNATKAVKENESHLSSESVLEELEKDEEFMKVMGEFVKYDDKVYQFAFDMHIRQYESFSRQVLNSKQIAESVKAKKNAFCRGGTSRRNSTHLFFRRT